MVSKAKIVLSTDIGFDPDDFIALNLCLANPRIDLKAILLDPGAPDQIGLVRSILKFHGVEIPLGGFMDHDKTLDGFVTERHRRCVRDLGVPVDNSQVDVEGWMLLDEVIEKDPDAVLVTIGPLSNAGRWFDRGKSFINTSYSMGCYNGTYIRGGKTTSMEYNFNADVPSALELISTNKIGRKVLISRNVTHHVFYTDELQVKVSEIKDESSGHHMIWSMMNTDEIFRGKMMHDPLTLLVALDENIVDLREVWCYYKNDAWGSFEKEGTGCFISIGDGAHVNHARFEELFLEH